jgi:hypothetical protein
MVSWRAAAVLWLVAGLSSALLIPFMTDPRMLAVYAIGAVVGIALAVGSLIRKGDRLAKGGRRRRGLGGGRAAIVLLNLSGPVEYLILPIWTALFGALAGWVSFRLVPKGA